MFFLKMDIKCYEVIPSPIPPDTHLELLPCLPADANEPSTIYVNRFSMHMVIIMKSGLYIVMGLILRMELVLAAL